MINKKEKTIIIVLFLILFASFFYGDTIAIVRFAINVWGSIAEGKGLHFYSYCIEQIEKGYGDFYCEYNWLMCFFIGIYEFPLWLIEKFSTNYITTQHTLTALYGKGILLIFTYLCAKAVKEICQKLSGKELSRYAGWFLVTSGLVIVNVCVVGQFDIIGICFELFGVLAFINNDKKKFYFYFSIAIIFKLYAVFLFIPLLLYSEKNIIKIIGKAIASFLPYIIIELIFHIDTYGHALKMERANEIFLNLLFTLKAPFMSYDVPILLLLLGILCAWCYLTEYDSADGYRAVYICFLAYVLVFISFPAFHYWRIRVGVYLIIILISNLSNFKQNILFELVGCGSLILSNYLSTPQYYELCSRQNGNIMLWSYIFPNASEGYYLEELVQNLNTGNICSVLNTMFVVCMLVIAYINRQYHAECLEEPAKKEIRKLFLIRAAVFFALGYFTLFPFFMNL